MADLGMAMIVLRANCDLLAMARASGEGAAVAEISDYRARAERGSGWLWDDEGQSWCSRDTITGRSSGLITSVSLLSFWGGLADGRDDPAMLGHFDRIGSPTPVVIYIGQTAWFESDSGLKDQAGPHDQPIIRLDRASMRSRPVTQTPTSAIND